MTTSTPPDNTVLVLHLPKVNGQTTPVVGAYIGVPLVAYDLVTDGEGAVVLVDPPLSGDMDRGDVMELWLEGETAALDSKTIVDPNAVTTMRIPKGRLHPDRVNLMYYTVTRNSNNIGTSTPSLEILYNRIRPGLKDRLTDPGGHSELKLLLPDAIKNGVGPDFVSAEVCVAYPYCRAYDLITLKCNGELLEPKPKVNPNQAPQPPNPGSEVPITICFTVTRAYLDKAKRLDQKLHFSCTVTDQIGNGPDTDAPWSPVQTVDEDLAGERLPEPILLERMEDYPGDDSSFIELEKLGGNPLLVIVVTSDNRFQPGDTVNAIYTAKLPGQTDVVVPVTGIVEADPFGQKKPCILQVPNDKILANSTVTVVYRLIRAGVDIAISKIAAARVIGENLLELKPPSLVETKDNNLNPVDAMDTLTAVVDYVDLKVGDQISVTWTGPAGSSVGGSHTTPAHEVKSLGEQKIPLPTAVIAYCLSKQATLTYTVTRGSAEPQPSQPFPVNVQALPLNELRAPILKQAANNGEGPELLLHELTAQGLMRFSSFAHIAAGQPVWLRLKGTNNDGSLYDNPLWKPPGAGINAGWVTNGYYEYAAPFNDLKNLKDGSPLTMEFKVGFGRSQVEAEAVTFPERTYSVRAIEIVVPTISSVKGSPSGVEIPNG
ncbi:hypothetical protein, partial [Pseudomonas sp.]|uniref:hypothetical protein n=1 Tax=Pseudomonas sp. TaxID=306 RepID=UPI00326649F8